ncbi:MAG: AI-2E family transporter [Verrucomicrobia bacterium]|nr:AI-2E family transporter [Verrucomicrobiota bacterium]
MSAEPATPFFSRAQQRAVAFALTLLAALGSVALIVGAFIVFSQLVGFFSGVLWPLAVAGVLALILRPVVELLEQRLRLRRLTAVVLLYGLFVLLAGAALLALLPPLATQVVNLIGDFPAYWERAGAYVREHNPEWTARARRLLANPTVRDGVDTLLRESKQLAAHAMPSLKAAGGGVLGVFTFATHLAIVPVYLFFFLLAKGEPTEKLPGHLSFLRPGLRDDLVFLLREFVAIMESFFRGQILIGLIMGALLAVGYTLVGLKFGLFIGLALGVLNIVPYLGTILGLGVALPLAFFQPGGGWTMVGLVLLVKIVVQCIEGWFLTPKIMGDRTGLHPVTIIVAVFFWGTAFGGVLGMLLAIPLTAFVVTAWRLTKQKYFEA